VRTKTPLQGEKILSVAARLFATHRFHEARMEDIAAAAGVGKGTLYRYFKDKDELYLALLSRAAEQLAVLLNNDAIQKGEPRRRLEAFVETVMHYFDEQPHLFDVIQHAEALRPPDREFPWQQTRELTIATVRRILEDGRAAGLFAEVDTELAVLLLLGGLRAVVRFGTRPRSPEVAQRIVTLVIQGIAATGARATRLATAQTA
jgi:AcrR family transcriptional regulator